MWSIQAIAILVEEKGQILLITEDGSRPEIGKYAGMLSIPMGHIEVADGEDPESAVIREFKEETGGMDAVIDYSLGFFSIEMNNRKRAGVWAYKGHLVGEVKNTDLVSWLTEKEFLSLDPFLLRPLNNEIFQAYALARVIEKYEPKDKISKIILDAMPKVASIKTLSH